MGGRKIMKEEKHTEKITISKPLSLDGTYNTRELGGYPAFSGTTQKHRCLRSDSLHEVTEEDLAFLQSYGVKRIIDLRGEKEVQLQPEEKMWNGEIEYFHIPIDDKMAAEGYQGKIPDKMSQLYRQILSQSQEKVRRVLELIAEAPEGTVVFHCAVGKDRTGVIAMLLLKICGVEDDIIIDDYKVSGANIVPLAKKQTAFLKERGMVVPQYIFESKEEDMRETLLFLEKEYGGIAGYLKALHISGETVWKLIKRICNP